MLLEIKNYLRQQQMVPLQQMAKALNCDEQQLNNMLQHWIQKGCCILRTRKTCSSCKGCPLACKSSTWVEWLGDSGITA